MAGVELQANALATILSGFPLRSVSGVMNLLVFLGLAALPPLLTWRFQSLHVLLGLVLVLFAYLDSRTIRPGQEWPREIHEAILGASVMLVLIGHHWLDEKD